MPIPPPPYELWEAVAFRASWPSADEDLMIALGLGWTNAGESFRNAAGKITDLPEGAWRDDAGRMYRERIPPLRGTTEKVAAQMLRLGGLARAYGDDVRYAKTELTRFIGQWDPLYADDPQTIGPLVAELVVTFLDLMSNRIVARGDGSGQEPLPGLPSPEQASADHTAEPLVPPLDTKGGGRQPEGPPWKARDDIAGPARGKDLSPPHPRHSINGSKTGEVSKNNSVILRGYEDAVREDVRQIAAGNARWNSNTSRYEINGRTYGIEPSGRTYPDSGPGLAKLNRVEYDALGKIAKADGDVSRVVAFETDPKFYNNRDLVQKAKDIYDGTF